ncbi:MAG TPA: antitoxin Xre/MbcA/ParS toxin-binding domain-containing protein [Acidobacteriaceae bacterium]
MAQAAKLARTKPFTTTLRLNLQAVESGVPVATMSDFVSASGVPLKDLYDIVIPARTLKHRRARRESLSPDESDKLARVVRIFDHAVRVFDGIERARTWLDEPKRRFDGRTPIEMLRTEIGARMVDEFLGQIEYGMFA